MIGARFSLPGMTLIAGSFLCCAAGGPTSGDAVACPPF